MLAVWRKSFVMIYSILPSLFFRLVFFFFFNDTATTEIYTLSLHDALPICLHLAPRSPSQWLPHGSMDDEASRSEEHTSELQSLAYLVCRLLLEKKKKRNETRFVYSILIAWHIYSQDTLLCHC